MLFKAFSILIGLILFQSAQAATETQKIPQTISLRKQLYSHFDIHALKSLESLKLSYSLNPVFWHVCLWLAALLSILGWAGLILSKNVTSNLIFFVIAGFFLTLSMNFKPRISNLNTMEARQAPFLESLVVTSLPPEQDLVVLKREKNWIQIRLPENHQAAWIQNEDIIKTWR